MYDLIIEGGTVVDGSGDPSYVADIGVIADKIHKIGQLKDESAHKRINAHGKIISPGFIDIHSHSDFGLFFAPYEKNKIMQGVTTEVVGHCGYSLYPVLQERKTLFEKVMVSENIHVPLKWHSLKGWIDALESNGIGVNVIPLVGHGTLRLNVLGFEGRKATFDEINAMKDLLIEAMEEGAFGLSTGLGYAPGMFSDTDELIELSKVLESYNGIYTSHLRNQDNHLLEAVQEAIQIGEKAAVGVNISHLKASGHVNWGKVNEAIALINERNRDKVKVICDFYPYKATNNSLASLFPNWLHEGGMDAFLRKLSRESFKDKAKKEMMINWSDIYIGTTKFDKTLEGRSIGEISLEQNSDAFDTACQILIKEKGAVNVLCHLMCNDDIETLAQYEFAAIGSDGTALPDDIPSFKGHPRNYGTFPKFLGRYVRDKNLISLEEGIRRMTCLPANFYGIKDRGCLKEGYYADIVVFDFNTILDRNTYESPTLSPTGIESVIVNGIIQLEEGQLQKRVAGKVLRKK